MKRIAAILFAVALVYMFAAGGSASQCGENAPKKITVGISMCMLDENHARAVDYYEKYFREYEGVEVKTIVTNAESSVEKEIGNIESLIMQEPDVILVHPVNSVGSIPAVQSILNAGIPCVDTGFCVEGLIATTKARGWDELVMGKMQGQLVNKYLEENPDKNLTAVYILGALAQTEQLKRYEGFMEECINFWGKDSERIQLVAAKTANWSTQEAMALTEDWLQTFPDINCIIAASDEMAIGAINVLLASGYNVEDFLIVSVDGTENGLRHVRKGLMDSTVYMAMDMANKNLVDVLIGTALGKDYGKEVYNADGCIFMVTKDNIDEIVKDDASRD